jgi:hypothetical protein
LLIHTVVGRFNKFQPVGNGIYIRFSKRLRKASSKSQGKFVAASTITNLPSAEVAPSTPVKKKIFLQL